MLQKINLGGETRPILFGIGAFRIYEQKSGKKANEFLNWFFDIAARGLPDDQAGIAMITTVDFGALVSLTAAALENAATYRGEAIEYTDEQVGAWLSVGGFEIAGEVIALLVQSLSGPTNNAKKKTPPTIAKKQQIETL
jgi:hypothetical protein